MPTPISSADSTPPLVHELLIRLDEEISAKRVVTPLPAVTPGDLDRNRAVATVVQCAGSAGLTPALPPAAAAELVHAFLDGDDAPFARCATSYHLPPDDETGLDSNELLILCTLLAAREQWAGKVRIVTLPDSGQVGTEAVCPVCGSLARLELLLGQYSERYVVCPACDALWRIPRVGCPYCGERDGNRLVVYNATERTDRALVHCQNCQRVWRRLHRQDRNTPPDDLFIHAITPWPEELLVGQHAAVLPVPLRPQRSTQ